MDITTKLFTGGIAVTDTTNNNIMGIRRRAGQSEFFANAANWIGPIWMQVFVHFL